ncbi:MAG TPA: hypothetical protein VLF93_05745 [Candidatus Saccharimonadales bacterium]|nr:hypothetical protein [Candidatus Saccharimonadales bacterium]
MAAEKGSHHEGQQSHGNVIGYGEFARRTVERKLAAFPGLGRWYGERVSALSAMTVSRVPLTGEGGWGYEATDSGREINKITSGFFDVNGYYVDTGRRKEDGSPIAWTQAGIEQKESEVTIPTPDGTVTMNASGLVGIIKDDKGRILLSVEQEPFIDIFNHTAARTPFQTSASKLDGIIKGNKDLDKNLSEVFDIIGEGKTPSELFQSGEVEVFRLAYADANRIKATNLGFTTVVRDAEKQKQLEANGRRWCTAEEVQALAAAGLVNGHTLAAVLPGLKLAADQSPTPEKIPA